VITAATEFITRHRGDKPLIIIDTLGKIKRAKQPGEEAYLVDYQIGTRLKALAAMAPGSTVLVVHHTRKAEAADFIDAVSGTQGLAGSVDFVIVLTRKRLSNDAVLSVTGRDIAEGEYALHADQGVLWQINGEDLAAAHKLVEEQKAKGSMGDNMLSVYELVRNWTGEEAVGASDVAAALTISADTARKNLNRLVKDGRINRVGRGRVPTLRVPSVLSVRLPPKQHVRRCTRTGHGLSQVSRTRVPMSGRCRTGHSGHSGQPGHTGQSGHVFAGGSSATGTRRRLPSLWKRNQSRVWNRGPLRLCRAASHEPPRAPRRRARRTCTDTSTTTRGELLPRHHRGR